MKNIRLKSLCMVLLTSATAYAQGTLADYQRAYGLRDQFQQKMVEHWAHDITWDDSTSLHYYIDTSSGRQYISYHVKDDQTQVFGSEDEMNKALNIKDQHHSRGGKNRKDSPFRHRERHWMETDDEQAQRVVKSPNGKMDAWIEGFNVMVHEVGKPYTEKRALTQDGTIGRYYSSNILWSPDSKKIMVCKRNKVEKRYAYYVESSPKDQLQPILHKQEYAKPGDELPQRWPTIIDVENGSRVEADASAIANQYALGWFQWLPDSKEVTMEYNKRGHQLYQMLAMDAETGKLRTVAEEKSNTFVNYSRIWRQTINDDKQLLWTSERDDWNHIYLYDLTPVIKKGKHGVNMRQITKGDWFVRAVQHVDEKQGVIYFSASGVNKKEDPYLVHFYRIDLDGKNMVCLTPDEGNHTVAYSPDYRYLVDTYSKVDQAPVTQLRSAVDGRLLKTLETADISKLKSNGWVAPEVFVAKGRDGKTNIWGVIQRPTNFDPSRKYPIIEYIYAGPGDAYTPKSFTSYNWNMTGLAELGFIVIQLDGMGTSYRGKKFEEVCYKNLQDAGFADRMAWIRAAARKYSYMDAENVGIFGASAGGQESTTAVLLHGDFYKAAYSSCGCHDNRMDKIWWNEQWMGWPVDSSYVRASNVYNAHKLKRPLMLVVGELDDNVDPASTMQVADALIKANKDFELVVLPGVHHTMGESYGEHKRYDFFVKHLLKVLPPSWGELEKND
ncbi:S9 family peptidase [Hallella bergensis]|uniref:S9 family peptidase n=1 Tax=Hallella bergensis TaxID=242750 RepID=UPI0023F31C0A|nr:S9 family peptidase [Hallella bergensis]